MLDLIAHVIKLVVGILDMIATAVELIGRIGDALIGRWRRRRNRSPNL